VADGAVAATSAEKYLSEIWKTISNLTVKKEVTSWFLLTSMIAANMHGENKSEASRRI
jgi:hypothetical protein